MSVLANYSLLKHQQGVTAPTSMLLSAAALGTMMQETPVTHVPTSAVTTDAQNVGLWYDQSVNAVILGSISAAARPVLGSGSGRNSWIRFNGSAYQIHVLSSISYFNKFWAVNPTGSFGVQIRMMGGDGALQRILDSNGGDATATGLQVFRSTGNLFTARATVAGIGVVWTVTSTTTFNVAAGWLTAVVRVAGVGTGTGLLEIYNSAGTLIESKTFNVIAGSTANAAQLFTVGSRQNSPDSYLNAQISSISMWSGAANIVQRAAFATYNPARSSTFTPVLQWKFDYSDPRFVYSDTAGQVPVTDGEAARVIRSQTIGNWGIPSNAPYQNLRRQFASAASGSSAIWRENGNQSYLEYDGTDDNYTLAAVGLTMMEEVGGKWTYVRVSRNIDPTYGSHLLSSDSVASNRGFYHTLTGSAYGVLDPNPRTVVHGNPNVNPLSNPSENTGVDDTKIMVWVRNGLNLKCYNGDGDMVEETNFSPGLTFNQMGLAYTSLLPNFNFHGRDYYFEKWNGVQDETWILNKIATLRARFPSGL